MQWWRFCSSANCPCCQCPLEDKQHIVQCPASIAAVKWQSFLTNLKSWLREQRTSPTLAEAILASLHAWYMEAPPLAASQHVTQLEEDQSAIGRDRIIEGWVPLSWRLEWTRKSSKRWTLELIKKLWEVAWDLWDQHNEALHTEAANWDLLDSQANDQIHMVYQQGSTTLPQDALALLCEPLNTQLQKPLATKLLWLQTIQATQERKLRHDHGAMAGEQRIMQRFLGLE